jgi:hypothetical protein
MIIGLSTLALVALPTLAVADGDGALTGAAGGAAAGAVVGGPVALPSAACGRRHRRSSLTCARGRPGSAAPATPGPQRKKQHGRERYQTDDDCRIDGRLIKALDP